MEEMERKERRTLQKTVESEEKQSLPLLLDVVTIQTQIVNLSKKKIRQIMQNGHFRTLRIGGKLYVERDEFLQYISDPDIEEIK